MPFSFHLWHLSVRKDLVSLELPESYAFYGSFIVRNHTSCHCLVEGIQSYGFKIACVSSLIIDTPRKVQSNGVSLSTVVN
jgi:hypothetical protein